MVLILTRSLGYVVFAWGCAFPPAVQVTLPELLENPRAYAHQEIEVSGLVMSETLRRRDFAYWHFHLRKEDVEIICYSEAYRTSAWSTLDHVIRRAAARRRRKVLAPTTRSYLRHWSCPKPAKALLSRIVISTAHRSRYWAKSEHTTLGHSSGKL
jgi:hypothetical protein